MQKANASCYLKSRPDFKIVDVVGNDHFSAQFSKSFQWIAHYQRDSKDSKIGHHLWKETLLSNAKNQLTYWNLLFNQVTKDNIDTSFRLLNIRQYFNVACIPEWCKDENLDAILQVNFCTNSAQMLGHIESIEVLKNVQKPSNSWIYLKINNEFSRYTMFWNKKHPIQWEECSNITA